MSLSTYFLKYGRHVGQLRSRRRRRRRAYAPTSNTASHDNHEKINSWVSFSFLYEYGAPLGSPLGHRSSATNDNVTNNITVSGPSILPQVILGSLVFISTFGWREVLSGVKTQQALSNMLIIRLAMCIATYFHFYHQ